MKFGVVFLWCTDGQYITSSFSASHFHTIIALFYNQVEMKEVGPLNAN